MTVSLWRIKTPTKRANVHEAGEGDDPKVPGVDDVAAIELGEEPALETMASGHNVKQRTHQKPIG